jgi:hypothetical protein
MSTPMVSTVRPRRRRCARPSPRARAPSAGPAGAAARSAATKDDAASSRCSTVSGRTLRAALMAWHTGQARHSGAPVARCSLSSSPPARVRAHSSTAANSLAASSAALPDVAVGHGVGQRSGSGSKRTRSRPVGERGPDDDAAAQRAGQRQHAAVPGDREHQLVAGAGQREVLAAGQRQRERHREAVGRALHREQVLAGRRLGVRLVVAVELLAEGGEGGEPHRLGRQVGRHAQRQVGGVAAHGASCSSCARTQPASHGSVAPAGRPGWPAARRPGSRTAPGR